jgi:hypothetical protein
MKSGFLVYFMFQQAFKFWTEHPTGYLVSDLTGYPAGYSVSGFWISRYPTGKISGQISIR